jgi:anaerobic magnesium-protoporphyrin IX monomethyl ester cyclase
MRVLLIHPAMEGRPDRLIRLPPLGLACVAGALREAGHEVRILDAAVARSPRKELDEVLGEWRPDAVGVSTATAQMPSALAAAARIKGVRGRIPVIAGGVHPTLFPAEVLGGPIDFAVHGEGERTMPELLAGLGGSRPLDSIPGIAHLSGGRPLVTARRPLIEDLDGLPAPAYDLLPLGRYSTPFSRPGKVISMVTSRGCPYPCTFCDAFVVHGRKYRAHSAKRVAAEMGRLADEFGIREVLFKDSEFVLDRDRTVHLCDLLVREGTRLSWTCCARVDRLDAQLLESMAAAGCRVIQLGVESGDPAVLETLKKRITHDQVRDAFRSARAAGIRTVANLMVGVPGETRGSVEMTERLVREIRPDFLNVQMLVPYPGTELHEMLTGGAGRRLDPIPSKEARRRQARLLRSFYLRPRRILGRVLTLNPRLWRQNLAATGELLKGKR